MTMIALLRPATLATLVMVAMIAGAAAQTTTVDPHHPDATNAPVMPPSGAQAMPGQAGQPRQWGMMGGTMGHAMMGQGTGPSMMGTGMMGMRYQMMKVMFAIADANGDGGLSFEEMTAVHKRIFDGIDANRDGKVVPGEVQAFMMP